MKTPTDYQKYHQLRDAMRDMIKAGQFHSEAFQDAWAQSENIKNRHGGNPPMPDDLDALEQELCEAGVEAGVR